MQTMTFELAQTGANDTLFAATFAIPSDLLSALASVTTTLTLSPMPLLRVVIDAIASLLFVTTQDGLTLCAQDGSPLIWP